jgi:ATP-dependent Clp protease ATP-binding subunit ClpC
MANYRIGEYQKAIELFEKALDKDPNFAEASYYTGMSHDLMGNYDKARFFYEKTLEIKPDYADVWNELGALFYKQNEHKSAEECYKKCLSINPSYFYAYYNLALIEQFRGNHEEEFRLLEKSIEIKPDYVNALNAIGIYYYNKRDYENAKIYYKKVIESNPNYKYAHYNLGLIAEIELEYEIAKFHYQEALRCDPAYEFARKNLEALKTRIATETIRTNEAVSPKSILQNLGRNLNELARQGKIPEIVGREKEINTILEILFKRFKNNPMIIGNAGVGKTAIVEGLAKRIVDGKVPDNFKNKEIIELNVGFILAGTKYRGEFEAKIVDIIKEVEQNENLILFIDEIHNIVRAGATEGGSLDLAEMLKPVLARGEFSCIGATTIEEYRKYIEKDSALERRFYPVMIEELSPSATKTILKKMSKKAKDYYNVEFTTENIDEIVELCSQYIRKRYFPDKAIDIFEKTAARLSLQEKTSATSLDIREVVSETAGITFSEDYADETSRLANIESALRKKIFGQDEAIDSISNIIRITKRRLDLKPERPDGVFLFTGPTGVGKTYFAKCLAEYLHNDPKKLISFDMSEFSEPHSVSKITGAPPGYAGYDDIPALSLAIEEHPNSILLLDEIEKAHPQVIKLFLQVFDEGKLTDSRGRKIYFSEVTIIMTSNALIRYKKSLGFGSAEDNISTDDLVNQLSKSFPKEFLNRIDEIIVFNPLSRNDIKNILKKSLIPDTQKRFLEREKINLKFDNSIVEHIINEGYSEELGARNLHRTFDKIILVPLVKFIYENNDKKNEIIVSYDGKNIILE